MACAVPEEVSERLTCAICMEQFKEPKALPCLHTYCKECLVKLVKKQGSDHVITCPDCRLDKKVPDGDVGKLQPNFWVNNFMTLLSIQDSTREQGTGKPLICERCDSGDSAVSRCTNCRVFMCEFCVTAHKRINAFKRHQILSLTEVENLGSKAPVKPAFCIKHPDETLKLFCDTCQKTICPDCTIIDHFEHKYDFVADVAERERKVVQAVLQETKAKDIAIEAGLKAVQAMESCVEAKITEVSKDVDVFFDAQVKALEYLRANLKYDVTTQGQMKLKELGNQKEMLALSLAQLRSSVEFAERALVDGDDMELLSMKQQLIQKLTQLNAPQFQCKPCNSDHLKLQVDKTIWDIGTMATLCYTPVNTTKYVLNMVGGQEGVVNQMFAGQPVRFVLSIKDGTAVNKSATGFVVHASVNHSRKPNLYEILPVHDNGDGSYLFCYRPVVDGLCTLTVTVGGENVLGSPFTWIVKPEQPEAKMTHEQSLLTKSSEQHKQLSAGQRPFFTPPQMQQVRPRWQPQQQMRPSEVQGIPGGGQVPRAKGMRQVAPRGMPRQQQQQPGGGGGMGWTQQVRGPEARQGQGERKRPAFKFQQNVRNQPQAHPGAVSMQAQAIHIPGQEPLYPSVLAAASPPDQKQILGERLFPLIQNMQPDQAAKITGMLLELDNRELLHMLESREALIAKIQEAVSVLRVHSAKEKRVEIKN